MLYEFCQAYPRLQELSSDASQHQAAERPGVTNSFGPTLPSGQHLDTVNSCLAARLAQLY